MKTSVLKPWFNLVAIAEDEATKEFFGIIKCRDLDGGVRRVTLPLADLDDRKALVKKLTNLGAYFSKMEAKNKCALDMLLAAKRKAKRINFAPRVGWYGSGYKVYVLAKQVIGAANSGVAIRPPQQLKSDRLSTGIRPRGEHAEWLRTVASHAKFSSRMVFGISAALAAPLLAMARLHSFGILVHGPGKAGKSTMLVAAASVCGYGREEGLPNFRATDAAFGEIPAGFNDSLLPLNELGLLKGSATEKYRRLRDFTYGFAEGRGTTYSKLASIEGGSGSKWLSISLATGEVTSNEIARDAREIRMAGESVRWIDLAATRNGAADIFDRIPKKVPQAKRKKWARNRCAKIRAGCRRNHGVAIQHFVEHIIRNSKTVQKEVKSLRRRFVNRVIDANDDPVVQHLAACFGHIYAAGIIGAGSGTLPWSAKTVRKCIERCYRDARRELNTESDLLRDGLKILRAKMRALRKANGSALESAEGFTAGGMSNRTTMRAEAFKGWFSDVRQANLVLKFLRSKNALPSRPTPKPGTAIVWAESQPEWPDGLRRRSIVINKHPGQLKI